MILLFLAFFASLSACSLVNQEIPNEAPVLESSRIDSLQVRRGGEIELQVRASDEDDDPLYYSWNAYRAEADVLNAIETLAPDGLFSAPEQISGLRGLLQLAQPIGGFRDSTAQVVNFWFAPQAIQGSAEKFLLAVFIRDRFCDIVGDPDGRQRCVEEAFQVAETFTVEVVQRPPTIVVTADTAISFRVPSLAIDATITDAEGDPLEIGWVQLEGPELDLQTQRLDSERIRLQAVPFFTGDYRFHLTASDGQDTISTETAVHIFPDPDPPAGGMVNLTLPNGKVYEIDVYEYPNRKGALPQLVDSWFHAAQLCAAQGKRLCSKTEWANACRGEKDPRFASSDDPFALIEQPFGRRFCNTTGSEDAPVATLSSDPVLNRAPSGSYPNCEGGTEVYDLTGNVREWVGRINALGQMVGGLSESDVQDIVPDSCGTFTQFEPLPSEFEYTNPDNASILGSEYSPYISREIGFRCCR